MQQDDAIWVGHRPSENDVGPRPEPLSAEQTLERIRSGEITTVIAGGCDVNGMFRAKRVPAERLLPDGRGSVEFGDYMWAMDLDEVPQPAPDGFPHWWPTWEGGFGDVAARSDPDTLRVVPWFDRTALVLCDYYRGHPSEEIAIAPRNVFRRVLQRYEALDLMPRLAVEYEFHVLRETDESAAAKHYRDLKFLSRRSAVYGALQSSLDDKVIGGLCDALDRLRLAIDVWGPEGNPGQYEINLAHEPALEAADQGFLFKHSVKELCALDGMIASFMPVIGCEFGSGLHVHQSLWGSDGTSAFHDNTAPDGMSPLMRHFVAGQLQAIPELACLYLPTPTAYKRALPHSAAGTTQTWGFDNKTVSVRVLTADAKVCRAEHRVPGSDANVYYTLAGMLASGLYGIENELEPPEPTKGDAYSAAPHALPANLERAAEAFKKSEVAREYLGDEFVDFYASTRLWEVEQFAAALTDWEFERYFVRG